MNKKLLIAAILGTMAIANTASASDPVGTVRAQLNTARDQLGNRGYRETHDSEISSLRQGRQSSYNIRLRQGMEYKIIGVCDEDCRDLDLILLDENGREVDRDTSDDDVPIISVSPRWTGPFTLKVQMAHCSAEPCAFGTVVMGR